MLHRFFSFTKKGVRFEWSTECKHAFEALKDKLTIEPVLSLPVDEGMYILDTDASEFGLGAVLSQRQNGQEHVIAYASRSMNRSELKYETTRKEVLAVVYRLKQFRQYLLGRHFVIRTDHAVLSWLRRTPEPMPQLVRWLTIIEQYDYEVVHLIGNRHGNADGLSRKPGATEPDIESPLSVNSIDLIDEKSSSEEVATSSVRESLINIKQQRSDTESTRIVQMQLTHTEKMLSSL